MWRAIGSKEEDIHKSKSEALLLDGGMGTELERKGLVVDGLPMWSTSCLGLLGSSSTSSELATKATPDPLLDGSAIQAVHHSYLHQGRVDCLTLATYQMSLQGCQKETVRRHREAHPLQVTDVVEAAIAAFPSEDQLTQSTSRPRGTIVLGSLGPLGATLPEGQEFKGEYTRTAAEFHAFHYPRVSAFQHKSPTSPVTDTGADGDTKLTPTRRSSANFERLAMWQRDHRFVVAFETFPRLDEALVAGQCAVSCGFHFYCSFTLDPQDPTVTAGGDPFAQVVYQLTQQFPRHCVGVGVNCVDPEHANRWFHHVLFEAQLPEGVAGAGTQQGTTTTTAPGGTAPDGTVSLVLYPNSGEIFVGGATPWLPKPSSSSGAAGNKDAVTTTTDDTALLTNTLPALAQKWAATMADRHEGEQGKGGGPAWGPLASACVDASCIVIGGCCRSTPEVIQAVGEAIRSTS
jgi:S-methylmethionine-dependent homocysteine/selenocysteine methylase